MCASSLHDTLLSLESVSLKMVLSVGMAGEMYIHGTQADGGEEPPASRFSSRVNQRSHHPHDRVLQFLHAPFPPPQNFHLSGRQGVSLIW